MEKIFTSQESEDDYYKTLIEAGLKELTDAEKSADDDADRRAMERLEKAVHQQALKLIGLTALVQRIADEQKYAAERAASERKLLLLEIESLLLRHELELRPRSEKNGGNENGQ